MSPDMHSSHFWHGVGTLDLSVNPVFLLNQRVCSVQHEYVFLFFSEKFKLDTFHMRNTLQKKKQAIKQDLLSNHFKSICIGSAIFIARIANVMEQE